MSEAALADLSKVLFSPTTIVLYLVAMLAYLYSLAFSRVDRVDGERSVAGRRALWLGTGLASLGVVAHAGHLVTRSLAAGGRVPWGNMFEFTSTSAFLVVLGALVVFQWRMRRPEVVAFLLFMALLSTGGALLLWTEPGPLMPILNSGWLWIHVFTIVLGFTVFTVGFVFTALYLLREIAEQRVADRHTANLSGSTVGAAYAGETAVHTDDDGEVIAQSVVAERVGADADPDRDNAAAYGDALRAAIDPKRLAAGTAVVAGVSSLVFQRPSATIGFVVLAVAGALLAWRFLPALPSAATLDSLTYRTIAFGFPIWTFAVIAGAIWAEQSWGRYWGWDPKETSAFLTWVAYAGYLHSRATRGMRGRNAAILGLVAFGVLYFTYFVVNLFVVGLHSYAGLS